MASKNSRVGRRNMADIVDNNSGCCRRFNYSNGAGWKTSKKWEHKISFSIKSKKRGGYR